MLAYYAHGMGFRTTLVSATRGEGGQNEIGPELFEALAVLRTEELLAAHRFDGASSISRVQWTSAILQHRRNPREMGQAGDPRRLCAHDSNHQT